VPAASAPAATPAPAPGALEADIRERPARAGTLERAQVKRAWPGVLAEIRKRKPARAHAFGNVEIDIDPDGTTVVVEFPRDQQFTMDLAEEPDTRELLRRALAEVLGGSVPFRYQLGRGVVRDPGLEPAAPATPPAPGDPEPATLHSAPVTPAADIAEPPAPDAAPAHEPENTDTDTTPDIEHLLVHGLGAQILAEHPHTDTDGKDD